MSHVVIIEPDHLFSIKKELLQNLKEQNVINTHRISIRRNGQVLLTKRIILTFKSSILPTKIT